MPPHISIVNYGVGNLRSVKKSLERAGASVEITDEVAAIRKSDAVILPGVGAFGEALKHLQPLKGTILGHAEAGRAIFGICLGLQLLFTRSFEGGTFDGLNLMRGDVVRLPDNVKQPHIGWNEIRILKTDPLLDAVPNSAYAYFVHSYYAHPEGDDETVAVAEYGLKFPAVFRKGNIFATQFHPEKSGGVGKTILGNFVRELRR